MAILDIQRRLAPAGRIRIGQQVPTGTAGKTRPSKLSAFRFTSSNKRAVEQVANLYGGEPHPWVDAPTEGQWEVFTEASEIPVVVPPERMSFSQFYETWSGGGCKRRCDGQWDQISDGPCVCDPENRECKPHTRLSVMLARLSGIGLWRLDTSGYYASEELGGSFEIADMLSQSLGRSVLPGILRLEQRVTKRDGKTNKFAVPVLDFDVDMGALALGYQTTPTGEITATGPVAVQSRGLTRVPSDELPVPSVAEQVKAIEAPKGRKPRSNAAEPVKRTGLKPKGAPQAQEAESPETAPEPKDDADEARKRNFFRLFNLLNVADRDDRLAYCRQVTGRKDIASSNDLTPAEADQIIAQLKLDTGEEPPLRDAEVA